MKNILKYLSVFSLMVLLITSCKKDENRVLFEGGENPVLSISATGPFVLDKDEADDVLLRFDWTNPNYMFNTGVSSHNVTYTLQVDLAGNDFASSRLIESAVANELHISYTVKEFNSFFSRMELDAGTTYNVQFRLKSSMANGAAVLYSNVLDITVTPYLDFVVEPPGTAAAGYLDGELWALGDALPSSWDNPMQAPYTTTQKFERVGGSILHYQAELDFNASGAYKLIQEQGNWGTQYHALDPAEALSGDFEKRDADPGFASPGVGRYKVEVNFQTGKYKLTKL